MRTKVMLVPALIGVALSLGACHAYVTPVEPVGDVEVTSAPVAIESQPSVVYEGHPTYFYGGRWYYRNGSRWVSYRHEPEYLRTYRVRGYRQEAPDAHPTYRQEAPPARRY